MFVFSYIIVFWLFYYFLQRYEKKIETQCRGVLHTPCKGIPAFAGMTVQGTGSKPLPPQGWQRKIRFKVSQKPLKTPCFLKASTPYCEHEGANRQLFGNHGEIVYWYTRIKKINGKINIFFIGFFLIILAIGLRRVRNRGFLRMCRLWPTFECCCSLRQAQGTRSLRLSKRPRLIYVYFFGKPRESIASYDFGRPTVFDSVWERKSIFSVVETLHATSLHCRPHKRAYAQTAPWNPQNG